MKLQSLTAVFLPLMATAFSPLHQGRSQRTIVQQTIASKWTMAPDDPTPEVSAIATRVNDDKDHVLANDSIFLLIKRLILVVRIQMMLRRKTLCECL